MILSVDLICVLVVTFVIKGGVALVIALTCSRSPQLFAWTPIEEPD